MISIVLLRIPSYNKSQISFWHYKPLKSTEKWLMQANFRCFFISSCIAQKSDKYGANRKNASQMQVNFVMKQLIGRFFYIPKPLWF